MGVGTTKYSLLAGRRSQEPISSSEKEAHVAKERDLGLRGNLKRLQEDHSMSTTKVKKRKAGRRAKRLPKGPHGGVELLLIQSVEHLGKQGEVVEVKPGFANNYLLPHGLATVATDHHKRMVEKHREKLLQIERARLDDLRSLAETISKQSVTIESNANDDGHLYGSVGAAEITAALKGQNIHLTADKVRLEGPLKEVGLYTVKLQIATEVEANLKVWVVPSVAEEDKEQPS